MRTLRILALFCICFPKISPRKKKKIERRTPPGVAVRGESTGWAIQLESEINIDGKAVHSIEVNSAEVKKFEALENKRVRATGKIPIATASRGAIGRFSTFPLSARRSPRPLSVLPAANGCSKISRALA